MKISMHTIAKVFQRKTGRTQKVTIGRSDSDSSSCSSDDSWDDLDKTKQADLAARGWNKTSWDKDDPDLMTFYNEAERDWHQLPEDRLAYWVDLGYDAKRWDAEESELHDNPSLKSDPSVRPRVLKVQLPELDKFDFSYYVENCEDMEVQVVGGRNSVSDERIAGKMKMGDFCKDAKAGDVRFKFNIEDDDVDKDQPLLKNIGDVINKTIQKAMTNSELGGKDGPFAEEWQTVEPDFFNWSIWLGGKGTRTPMHFDTDLFNFLYVVEGKKRVVIIPNDHRTDGMFKLKEFFSGSGYTGVDIHDPNFKLPEGSLDVEVGPGQGIFIPFRYWHAVENMEKTVAYGFRVLE